MINIFSGLQKRCLSSLPGKNKGGGSCLRAIPRFGISGQRAGGLGSDSAEYGGILENRAGSMLSTTMSAAVSIVNGVSTLPSIYFCDLYSASDEVLSRQFCSPDERLLPEPAVKRTPYIAAGG